MGEFFRNHLKNWQTTPLSQKILMLSALALLALLCVYPFLFLLQRILFFEGSFDLSIFEKVLSQPSTQAAVHRTFWVSLATSCLSVVIAVPMAWLLTRTNLKGQKRLRSWLCFPYAIPPYIGAIAWIYLANPTTGLLNQLFGESLFNIYTFTGLIWVESSFMYTFILLTTLSSLDRMDSSLEEAARLSGASPAKVFFDITLPLIRPAILSGALLTFLATAASFGVPALIGSPARIYLLTTQIYTYQKMGTASGLLQAGSLAFILLSGAAIILILNQRLTRNKNFQTVGGKTSRPSLIDLKKWNTPLLGLILIFFGIVFLLPMLGIFISAVSRIQGTLSLSNFTLDNITRTLFEVHETPRALANSVMLGVLAATFASLLGLVLSYFQTKTKIPGRNWIDVVASLPYSAPGTVVALALILTMSGGFFGLGNFIYNSLAMLLIAYVIKYLSFTIKTNADGFQQIDNVLAEAARVSGASWFTTLKTIWIPLMRPSLIASWFLVFMPVVSELTMTLPLAGPGQETIGTLIYQLQEYSDASGGGASVIAVFVVLSVVAINYFVKLASKGKYGL